MKDQRKRAGWGRWGPCLLQLLHVSHTKEAAQTWGVGLGGGGVTPAAEGEAEMRPFVSHSQSPVKTFCVNLQGYKTKSVGLDSHTKVETDKNNSGYTNRAAEVDVK